MSEEKRKKQEAIREVVGSIQKSFGQGAIMRLGDGKFEPIAVIPSGRRPTSDQPTSAAACGRPNSSR